MSNSNKECNREANGILPPAEDCIYTNCYCEENVWKLCDYIKCNSPDELPNCYAVFISNSCQAIPLWCQKAAKDREGPVVWDYHVIFVLRRTPAPVHVYDLDSILPFPCDFRYYASNTFKRDEILLPQFYRMFRVIPGSVYLDTFASDRSHMRMDGGMWANQPPNYPCIQTSDTSNNLASFINMDSDIGVGEIFNLEQFENLFDIDSHLDTR